MTTDTIDPAAKAHLVGSRTRGHALAMFVKRLLDIVLALLSMLVVMPICVGVALVIKLTSEGPVFYRQRRVGRHGATFTLVKFRSMAVGTHEALMADHGLRQHYEDNGFKLSPDDPRITSVGRILRKSSIDELPQLVNVLLGHMSLVGVRPLVPAELDRRDPADQVAYRSMRPGMTGLWQVEGRSSAIKADRLALDRRYVEEWSLLLDLAILLRTPLAVLRIRRAH